MFSRKGREIAVVCVFGGFESFFYNSSWSSFNESSSLVLLSYVAGMEIIKLIKNISNIFSN